MRCLDDHHHYELDCFEDEQSKMYLKFIKKEKMGLGSDNLLTVHDGTTNEEVLKMLIHRLDGLYKKFPSDETLSAKDSCYLALQALEARTKDREQRGVEGKHLA